MRIPTVKINGLRAKAEEKMGSPVISSELQGRGSRCPHCSSLDLEHGNKYPRFTGKAIIYMTKCNSCGMLFDEPKYEKDPWVIFRTERGIMGFRLDKKDIED